MGSTAHATDDLTPAAALQEIGRVERIQDALERRTTGVTWMIWGIAAPAIFLSYSYAGALGVFEGAVPLWAQFLWAPWVLLGVIATIVLWRSVGLVVPTDPQVSRLHGVLTMATFLLLIFGTMALLGWLDVALNESAIALVALGVANVGMGSFGIQASDRTDRVAWLGAGTLLVLVAAVGSYVLSDLSGETAHRTWSLLATFSSAGIYFATGLFLANRG